MSSCFHRWLTLAPACLNILSFPEYHEDMWESLRKYLSRADAASHFYPVDSPRAGGGGREKKCDDPLRLFGRKLWGALGPDESPRPIKTRSNLARFQNQSVLRVEISSVTVCFACLTNCFHSAPSPQDKQSSVPFNTYWRVQAVSLTVKLVFKSKIRSFLTCFLPLYSRNGCLVWKCVLMLLLTLNRTMLGLAGQMRFIQTRLLLSLPCAPVWVLCFFAPSSANTSSILMGSLGSAKLIWWWSTLI